MAFSSLRRAVAIAVVVTAVPAGAWAQNGPQSERDLLQRISKAPNEVGAYLDLVKLYVDEGRFDDAQRMLANAQTVVGQQRMTRTMLGGVSPMQVPAPPPPVPDPNAPMRVGNGILEPKKIRDAKPEYPAQARAAQIGGIVILSVVVTRDGGVRDVRVLRGLPMLNDAAVAAVEQWRYTPTLLNGVPIELAMTVTVNFIADRGSRDAVAATGPAPVRVGSGIREPYRIKSVGPVYPADAQAAKVTGIVILEAIIGVDGRITDAKVLRGVPMLNQAALDAVRLWEYEPTYVNGVATPVVMTVTVNFSLK